jgi:glycerophosphoryl diester phosphodiesterase
MEAKHIITFGHRGAAGLGPEKENTLLGFRTALSMGVDGIELDVYRTQDDQMVVTHSDTLEYNGDRVRVSKLVLDEIKQIQLPGEQTLPTLDEVFVEMEAAGKQRLFYSIDLRDVRDADAYHEIVSRHGVVDRLFTCFESRLFIKKVRRAFPDLTYVFSTHPNVDGIIEDLDRIEPGSISVINIPATELTEAMVDAIHGAGLKSFVWDANEDDQMARFVAASVDAIYSNFPDRLVSVVRTYGL